MKKKKKKKKKKGKNRRKTKKKTKKKKDQNQAGDNKKKHATSGTEKKIMQPLGTKKSLTSRDIEITQPLATQKIMQPLGTNLHLESLHEPSKMFLTNKVDVMFVTKSVQIGPETSVPPALLPQHLYRRIHLHFLLCTVSFLPQREVGGEDFLTLQEQPKS